MEDERGEGRGRARGGGRYRGRGGAGVEVEVGVRLKKLFSGTIRKGNGGEKLEQMERKGIWVELANGGAGLAYWVGGGGRMFVNEAT